MLELHPECAMMGVEALQPPGPTPGPTTTTPAPVALKRKLAELQDPPEAKTAKWEEDEHVPPMTSLNANTRWEMDEDAKAASQKWEERWESGRISSREDEDCIARLRALAVPASDSWRVKQVEEVDLDEDEDFEEELSEDEDRSVVITRHPQQFNRYPEYSWQQYYQPQQPQQQQQQTIRREENGKSYLELGRLEPSAAGSSRRWCHSPCYRQRRLAVLNMSMCKLARYRQCSDPSLRRSVLICNTLRRLEREMESEPPPPEPAYQHPPVQTTTPSRMGGSGTVATNNEDPFGTSNNGAFFTTHSLRELSNSGGRATPFPAHLPDTDSGLGDDDDHQDFSHHHRWEQQQQQPINWGSVLSLTSQTEEDEPESIDNNELYAELGLSLDHTRAEDEWEGFSQVLVGGGANT